MTQVIKGLRNLHKVGYVHNDIKAENIMLDFDYNVIIIDFGCATKYIEKKVENDQL